MLPAEWGDMSEQFVRYFDAVAAQMPDGAVEIDGVPQRHGRGDEGQPGRAMTLVLENSVAQLAEPIEEDCKGKRIARLALVKDAAGAASLFWIVEPVEHEQGALDSSDLAQHAGDRVLTRICTGAGCRATVARPISSTGLPT